MAGSSSFLWLGEQRALDFLNTEPMVRGERLELLANFDRLVAWCEEAGLISRTIARDALGRWGGSRTAAQTVAMARRLRRDLRRIIEQRVAGKKARAVSLESLNACLRLEGARAQVVVAATPSGFERREQLALTEPRQLLRPIAEAAAQLLCTPEIERVLRCDNPQCVLYFRDVSKNHTRRWCSMALCGNRMKVAAHHERRRAQH